MAIARGLGRRDAAKPPARNDAYTGMLVISLVAMLIGCLLLGLDMMSYGDTKPPAVNDQLVPPVKGK